MYDMYLRMNYVNMYVRINTVSIFTYAHSEHSIKAAVLYTQLDLCVLYVYTVLTIRIRKYTNCIPARPNQSFMFPYR